ASAQDHQLRRQIEIEDLARAKEAVLLGALLVEQRQDNAAQLRMSRVQESVSGEMNVAVVGQFIAGRGSLVGGEIQGAEPLICGREREYRLSLLSSEGEPLQSAADIAQTEVPRRSDQIVLKRRRVRSYMRNHGAPVSLYPRGRFEPFVTLIKNRVSQRGDGLRRRLATGQFLPQLRNPRTPPHLTNLSLNHH